MRLIAASLALLLALAAPALAASYGTPRALLEHIYGQYAKGESVEDQDVYSQSLQQLFAADRQRASESEDAMSALDFDPFVLGQEVELGKVEIADPVVENGVTTVAVHFENVGNDYTSVFSVVEEDGGCKIDDIAWPDGSRLSKLLASDPLLN